MFRISLSVFALISLNLVGCAWLPSQPSVSASVPIVLPVVPAAAPSFRGRWEGSIPGRGKESHQDYQFVLDVAGDKVSGFVITPSEVASISTGIVSGVDLKFSAGRREYSAQMKDHQLHVNLPARGKPQILLATHTSAEPVRAPVTVSLPVLRTLPANGLATTPPMGWNSWNKFRVSINDKLVREIADALVETGMKKVGYIYLNIDDGWEGERTTDGTLQSNANFPNMKALSDYVHSKGLKLGIYSSPGPRTCAGFEGSFNHEEQDARTFAAWGIDYLKYDWCSAPAVYEKSQMRAAYQKMGEALVATGRPIVYSLCQYGMLDVETWGPAVGGNLWRTTGDINATWERMSAIGFDQQGERARFAAPSQWNDPDMLEVGNPGLNEEESRTHMSLWALLAAPLIAGNDVRTMAPATRDILNNEEVIAIDQDPAGKQGARVSKTGLTEIWSRPLDKGDVAIGLFNRSANPATVNVKWADLGLSKVRKVRDVWKHEIFTQVQLTQVQDQYSVVIAPHGVVLLRVSSSR